MSTPPPIFEILVHVLEFCVVIGIGVMVYLSKKQSDSYKKDTEDFDASIYLGEESEN